MVHIRVISDNIYLHHAVNSLVKPPVNSGCQANMVILDGGHVHTLNVEELQSACHLLILVEFRVNVNLIRRINPSLSVTCLPEKCTVDFFQAVLRKIILDMQRKLLCPHNAEKIIPRRTSHKQMTFMKYYMKGESLPFIADRMAIRRKTSEYYRAMAIKRYLGRLSVRTIRLYHSLMQLKSPSQPDCNGNNRRQ